ncbi:hypothetical protein BpHYR1_035977 [Brachionus plicatilis]|uniref:SAP domain-containing protein n=1 Tax=Brachionus plicatilis TaxID=10195 RepID=A0A3M7PDP9_BRAPC|nr:hypothetical protein BpHYR1_035977 [Brachionus plicatilis]
MYNTNMLVTHLKDECKRLKISYQGKRSDLVKRLNNFVASCEASNVVQPEQELVEVPIQTESELIEVPIVATNVKFDANMNMRVRMIKLTF